MQTKSLCPECKKVIDTTVYEENGQVLLKKTCPEHGTFKDVYWSDAALYKKFAQFQHDGTGVDNPMTERDKGCPYDCGLCPEHKTTTVLSLIDVTNRCNQKCPVCFANAAATGYVYEPSIEQIREMMQLLVNEKPVRNWAIQFSGGEPTVRDDLPAIIGMARDFDFIQIQIATNGLHLAHSVEYCRELREAGLHTVYLQFDSMTPEPYFQIRGFNALPVKMRVIENCRKSGLTSVTLVPTLMKGVNDDQIGDIIRFASQNLDVVKGVNMQPVSFAGRIDQEDREKWRITIPGALKCIEEQTDFEIAVDDFYPVPFVVPISNFGEVKKGEPQVKFTMHPHCGAGTYVYVEGGHFIPITRFIDVEGLLEYLGEVAETYDHKMINKLHVTAGIISHITQFIDAKKAPKSVDVKKLLINALTKGTEDVIKQFHRKTLFLGMMHFQDLYNIDLERVQRCGIHYATPDGRAISFCSYNNVHREIVEQKFSVPLEEWERAHTDR